ncbi:hypothetical protein K9M79_00190 [Candidatus Woesearchaeota archaeon]|nr:hypothetical protein [Candidatus Woesearchaeota archaeon]
MEQYIDQIKSKLNELIGMPKTILTDRGNSAIMESLNIVKQISQRQNILIPEEGGWLTYKKYPGRFGLTVQEVKCRNSQIVTSDLIDKSGKAGALMYSEPGGYFASQQMKQIYNICHENQIIVILDITGCIGRRTDYSKYSDMLLASFGKGKPVNLGYGGILGIKQFILDELETYKSSMPRFQSDKLVPLLRKFEQLDARYEFIDREIRTIKNDLTAHEIIDEGSRGLVVIVKFKDEKEKETIINYCENNKYEYTICPRYIRYGGNAVSIEVKRLDNS